MKETEAPFPLDERVFSLKDVVRFWRAQRRRWIRIAMLGGALAFLFFATRPVKYRAEATFKEGVESSGTESVLKDLFSNMQMGASQPQASVLMKSYAVLRPLVEKLGLQVSIEETSSGRIEKTYRRIAENLRAEWGKRLEDPDRFVFQDVVYEGESPLLLFLKFEHPGSFTVFAPDKKTEIGQGALGEETIVPQGVCQARFKLTRTPKKVQAGKWYPMKIGHWSSAVDAVRGGLKIASEKGNKSIYNLIFSHRDRHLGADVLNQLMEEYRLYLKREHDFLSNEQLAYLGQKQEQLYGNLAQAFDDHVIYLKQNLEEKGCIGLQQESESLLAPYQEMAGRLLAADVELGRLQEMQKQGKPFSLDERPFSVGLKQLVGQIQELRQQKDLLEIALQKEGGRQAADGLQARREELQDVRSEREAVDRLLEDLEEGREIPFSSFDWNQNLSHWIQSVSRAQQQREREDLCDYLENYSRLLSVREKMLQERFLYGSPPASEFEGQDLEALRGFSIDYTTKLEAAEARIRYYSQLREEILTKDFELGSLSALLTDPLSQKLIAGASEIALKINDEKNYSAKEGERWQSELALQRKILSDHLAEQVKVEELNASILREKLSDLQRLKLGCVNRMISVLEEQQSDAIKQQKEALLQEKKVLREKMEQIRDLAKDLPKKWRLEKWLELKTDMSQKIMEALTQLVETKTIGHHLHHVESKPLDGALLPFVPVRPFLFTRTLCGAFGLAFGTFFLSLIRTILRGFPSSLEKLQALRLPVLGLLSGLCDGPAVDLAVGNDLEILRRMGAFLQEGKGKVVALVGGKGPDYSCALAENLARISCRSLVLRCDFRAKFRAEDLPGIAQVCKGEIGELPIRKGKGYDFLTAGGHTPFGTEILQSRHFQQIVELLKNRYDWIFLLSRAPLESTESTAALRLCDQAIVTVRGEPTEQLTPFVNWAYHEESKRLTFVVAG